MCNFFIKSWKVKNGCYVGHQVIIRVALWYCVALISWGVWFCGVKYMWFERLFVLWLSLHMNQVADQTGAWSGSYNMKQLGVFLLPLDWMLIHRRVTLSIIHLGGERHCESKVSCPAGLELGQLNTEMSALSTRRPRLPPVVSCKELIIINCNKLCASEITTNSVILFDFYMHINWNILERKHVPLLKLNFWHDWKVTRNVRKM